MDKEQVAISDEQKAAKKKEVVIAQVMKTKGDRAIVELYENNSKKKSGETLDALNNVKAKEGYIVKVSWREINKTKDKLMLLVPPIFFIIAGVIFSYAMTEHFARRKVVPLEDVMIVGVGIWAFLGLMYSFRYWRYTYGRGLQPTVIDVVRKE